MPLRDFGIPNQSGAWDFHEVAAYLTAHGYQLGPGGIGTALDPDVATTVIVRVDLDPHIPDDVILKDLTAFAPDHTPVATAQVAMRQAVAQLAAIEAGTAKVTEADELALHRTVILAYAVTLGLGG